MTRSLHRYRSSFTSPPSATVSTAPSSSGKAYITTDCSPPTPSRCHEASSWMSVGEATTYGTFLAERIVLATSAWRPASMLPAGPPACARVSAGGNDGQRPST